MASLLRPSSDPLRLAPALRAAALGLCALGLVACSGGARPAASDPNPPSADAGASVGDDLPDDEGAPEAGSLIVHDALLIGQGPSDIHVVAGLITAIEPVDPELAAGEGVIDAGGAFVVPAAIDSHVHFLYREGAAAMAAGGIAAAVDLAAPTAIFEDRAAGDFAPLRLLVAGPMLAAPGGYPTQGWGAGGFGWECADTSEALAAVDALADAGAAVIKVSLELGPRLADSTLQAVIERAHQRGLKVAAHALSDADAGKAASLGVDVLAHVPLELLSPATFAALEGKAVITTLHAFGATGMAIENLRALHKRGTTILYGTDYGNTSIAGIDALEVGALAEADLDGLAILRAMTEAPAKFWGLPGGVLAVGAPASLLILAGDPTADPTTLAAPRQVILDGVVIGDDAGAPGQAARPRRRPRR